MTLQQLRYVIMTADCGSMNEAAKRLFISQPSLSGTIKELEEEIGLDIFLRSNRGIVITPEGEEFLGYARQVAEQYRLLTNKYLDKESKKKFSVSMQHYTFAVKAFVEMVKKVGMDQYEFAIHETKTHEVIENVRNFRSEIGILYLNDFNEQVMSKLLRENSLEFTDCSNVIRMFIYGAAILSQERPLFPWISWRSIPVLPLIREKTIPFIWQKK